MRQLIGDVHGFKQLNASVEEEIFQRPVRVRLQTSRFHGEVEVVDVEATPGTWSAVPHYASEISSTALIWKWWATKQILWDIEYDPVLEEYSVAVGEEGSKRYVIVAAPALALAVVQAALNFQALGGI